MEPLSGVHGCLLVLLHCADALQFKVDVARFAHASSLASSPASSLVQHQLVRIELASSRSLMFPSPPLPPSSLRKAGDRVAVWTKTASAEKACLEIGGEFRSAIAECLQGEVMDENERPRALAC